MTGQALFLSGKAADNAVYVYSGTVARGTINGSVYTGCEHSADYLSPSLQARQIIEMIQTSEKNKYDWDDGTASLRFVQIRLCREQLNNEEIRYEQINIWNSNGGDANSIQRAGERNLPLRNHRH